MLTPPIHPTYGLDPWDAAVLSELFDSPRTQKGILDALRERTNLHINWTHVEMSPTVLQDRLKRLEDDGFIEILSWDNERWTITERGKQITTSRFELPSMVQSIVATLTDAGAIDPDLTIPEIITLATLATLNEYVDIERLMLHFKLTTHQEVLLLVTAVAGLKVKGLIEGEDRWATTEKGSECLIRCFYKS